MRETSHVIQQEPARSPHKPFIDKHTGEIMQGEDRWQTLDRTFYEYVHHPEHKFENGRQTGVMQRKHVKNPEVTYIGKEARNTDLEEPPEQPIELQEKKKPKKPNRQLRYYN